MEQRIAIKESIQHGWETFKKRPWFIIGAVALMGLFSTSFSYKSDSPEEIFAALPMVIVFGILFGLLRMAVELLFTRFLLQAHDDVEHMTYRGTLPAKPFWKYVGGKIAVGIVVAIGFILLIIPGIIAAIALMFTPYLIVDRKLGPIEAMKESARMTKGHRWRLFLFGIVLGLLNIAGALALLVGLFVSIPVSALALVHVYRALEKKEAPTAPIA